MQHGDAYEVGVKDRVGCTERVGCSWAVGLPGLLTAGLVYDRAGSPISIS